MTELQQKQLDLLNDTINFFNSKNRAIEEDVGCKYHTSDGKGCAIGRLIPDKELCKKLDAGIGAGECKGIGNDEVFELIPEELQQYGREFLRKIQILHDDVDHWKDDGISEYGLLYVESVKKQFNLN